MIITRKLKLYPPNKAKQRELEDVARRFKRCVNYWIRRIQEEEHTKLSVLQKKYYHKARRYTGLSGVLTQNAEMMAIRIARTAKKKRKDSPFLKNSIIISYEFKVDGNNLGITFGKGYFWIPFGSSELPKGKILTSSLQHKNGAWYCNLAIEVAEPKIRIYKNVLGVDLGLAKIAAVSNQDGQHNVFFRGEPLRAKKRHYQKLRAKLQPKIKQGNVYKLLKRISRKEKNWTRNTNHHISRSIVNYAYKYKHGIALENLTGITERLKGNKKTRKMLKGWSFSQLALFIKYKAQLAGLEVSSVDPRGTSKTCPKCHFSATANRISQERFKCKQCAYESNADRIGAMNIAYRATVPMVKPSEYGQQATASMSA